MGGGNEKGFTFQHEVLLSDTQNIDTRHSYRANVEDILFGVFKPSKNAAVHASWIW